jgi:nitroimidazol reductase NimA-like FMN-containing flavoprotein (pyridoxamine 5'-phosphate oxidase superfamily)
MNSVLKIRDIGVIENELKNNYLGVLSYSIEEDKINQVPVTYLYLDKNIYILFKEDDERIGTIKYGAPVFFTIIKNESSKAVNKLSLLYKSSVITISGSIKIVDEQKTIEEIRNGYKIKYNYDNITELTKISMIDTQEFKAVEYSGE